MENSYTTDEQNIGGTQNIVSLGNNGVITALFTNPHDAEEAYEDLIIKGYKAEDITIAMSEKTRDSFTVSGNENITTNDLGTKSAEGTGIGAAIGGSIGAIAAAIAAIGTSLIIPGLGIVVAGSLAAGLAGAGAGVAAGGLVGALVGYGIPNEQAKLFEAGIESGGVVIGVKPSSDEERTELHKQWSALSNADSPDLDLLA